MPATEADIDSSDFEVESYSDADNDSGSHSSSESEDDLSETSQLDEGSSDLEFQLENQENGEGSDLEDSSDEPKGLPKQEQRRKLQLNPKQGDSWHQNSKNIYRLMMQAESSGKSSYLGPAVGWDEKTFLQYLKRIDADIPDFANIPGKVTIK
jgi:hypothetical protein